MRVFGVEWIYFCFMNKVVECCHVLLTLLMSRGLSQHLDILLDNLVVAGTFCLWDDSCQSIDCLCNFFRSNSCKSLHPIIKLWNTSYISLYKEKVKKLTLFFIPYELLSNI